MESVSATMEILLLMDNVKDSHVLMLIMCMILYRKVVNVRAHLHGLEENVSILWVAETINTGVEQHVSVTMDIGR